MSLPKSTSTSFRRELTPREQFHLETSPEYGKPAFCSHCMQPKPRTPEYFPVGRSRRGKAFMYRVCRPCKNRVNERRKKKRKVIKEWESRQTQTMQS